MTDTADEFADTRSDQREHPPADVFGLKAHRVVGYMDGACQSIADICAKPGRTKIALEGQLAKIDRIAKMARAKAAE